MADKEDTSASQLEEAPPARPGFGTNLKRHYKRFWWLHILIFIAIFLIIFLPIYYVGYPHIAQKQINQSRTEIKSMVLTNPSPTSFELSQHAVLYSNSSYHPNLDAFNASLSLGNSSDPSFAQVEIPATHSNGSANVYIKNQTLQLTDDAAYANFCKAILGQEEFELVITGRPKLHEMKFPVINVDYHPVVTMKGLNNLNGISITNVSVPKTTQSDGANMIGNVTIPNTSVLTIELGDVSTNLYVLGTFLGTSALSALTLYPGNNTFPMRSKVNETVILLNIDKFRDGVVPIGIHANSSVYNGVHIPYYEAALQSSNQTVAVNISAILSGAA